MRRPNTSEHSPYHETYIGRVPETDLVAALRSEAAETVAFLRSISDADSLLRHAPYTWSTREVVGHVVDGERIFGCRALRFARGDATPLPGYDDNAYVEAGAFDRRSLADLIADFEIVRAGSIRLFESFGDDESIWDRRGIGNNAEITVRALGYIMVGHERHHMAILRKRFGR